jgi:hypothetical protein
MRLRGYTAVCRLAGMVRLFAVCAARQCAVHGTSSHQAARQGRSETGRDLIEAMAQMIGWARPSPNQLHGTKIGIWYDSNVRARQGQAQQNRHGDQDQRVLQHEPCNDRDRQRLLNARALSDRKRQWHQGEHGG